MDFLTVAERVFAEFDKAAVSYAIIGGFAMGLRGAPRTTLDVDLLLLAEDAETVTALLKQHGYTAKIETPNVLQFTASDPVMGAIDIVLARRTISRSMLQRAERVPFANTLSLPVLQTEDIIGLKIQAMFNDPSRTHRDLADIDALLSARVAAVEPVDWPLLEDYCALFDMQDTFAKLKERHDPAE